nr:hypothetical protein [Paenibacillus apii]
MAAGADIIMLDNMSLELMTEAVRRITTQFPGRPPAKKDRLSISPP